MGIHKYMENKESKTKSTWGGKRREGKTQTNFPFRIQNDLIDKVREQKNQNRFINDAIREKLNKNIS